MEDCVDEPLTVAVAVKVAVPTPTAVITPEESTVATVVLLDDHVTVVAWAAKLQRELRASLREDLAQVLRELGDAKPDTTHPQPPAAHSPGSAY